MTRTEGRLWNTISWLAFSAVVSVLAILLAHADVRKEYQDAAIERGYAEWVMLENGRGDTEWRWIEPEGVIGEGDG